MKEALPEIVELDEKVPFDLEPIKGFIEIEVRDCKGRVVQKGKHEMRSFLNNFLKTIEAFARNAGVGITKTDGSSDKFYPSVSGATSVTVMNCMAGDNDSSFGIVVGSGTTSVTLTQYALASQIAHGTSAGQLDYDTMSYDILGLDTSVSPPVYRFRILRTFKNLSGGSINITEVGLVALNVRETTVNKFMIARDVLPQAYTVPDGGSATVVITIEVVLG